MWDEATKRPREQPEVLPDGAFVMGGEAANDELVLERADGSDPGQQLLEGGGRPPPEPQDEVWTDREYVYGPGYVDEFVCQIDRYDNVIYMLQDANYNVVALVSGNSEPGGPPPGTILEQYAYEPYGAVIVAETFAEHAVNRVGHQGLFFERLDGDFTQRTVSPTDNGLYYNRNRWYSPHLGRFLQRDPNETGVPILAALAMNGDSLDVFLGGFNVSSLYSDGMNLFLFAGSNPIRGRDPAGLFSLLDTLATAANTAFVTGVTWAMAYPTAMQIAGGILAAANLYMMVVDPDFQAMVWSQPGAMGFIEADIRAILSAGGSLKGLLRASAAAASLTARGVAFGKAVLGGGIGPSELPGKFPAVLKNGRVYVHRFHAEATRMANGGQFGPVDADGWAQLDDAGQVTEVTWAAP